MTMAYAMSKTGQLNPGTRDLSSTGPSTRDAPGPVAYQHKKAQSDYQHAVREFGMRPYKLSSTVIYHIIMFIFVVP